ncbi:MAG: GH36-type glycosyl hydrolase domain-containing protein, partial [Gemmatimonadaceae bacterium]
LDTVDRLEVTLDAMERLERLRGHFYNWYDTTDGRPLEPRYLSAVDSGNLAGALITLAGGCQNLLDRPPVNRAALAGVSDTARLIREAMTAKGASGGDARFRRIHSASEPIVATDKSSVVGPVAWVRELAAVETASREVATLYRIGDETTAAPADEIAAWVAALSADIASHVRDRDTLVPWAAGSVDRTAAGVGELAWSWQSLAEIPAQCALAAEQLHAVRARLVADGNTGAEVLAQLDAQAGALDASSQACEALAARIRSMAERARALVKAMDFTVLYDRVRKLFSIGLRVSEGTLDSGLYDLLASEARLTSLVAIAKGDVPVAHWFHLGRALTPVGPDSVLVSWSGSMFEYL